MLPLKWVQHQEIVVPGDNVSRPTTHSKLQKLVVARVATVVDRDTNLDPFGCAGKRGQKLPRLIFGDVRAEFFPAEHFVKFCHDRHGDEYRATIQGMIKSAARDRFVGQGCAYQCVGVKDEAQVTRLSKGFPISPA